MTCGNANVTASFVPIEYATKEACQKGKQSWGVGNYRVVQTPSSNPVWVPARTPNPIPVYRPKKCPPRARSQIPLMLWQTGRGNSVREHNNATQVATHLATLLMGDGIKHSWHNDTAARLFVASECPFALHAYDCLRPHAYRADLWRYCVLYRRGGFYLDAEDVPLVPLSSLVRPCDTLVLANDMCSFMSEDLFARRKSASSERPACPHAGVQISFMAAIPGHPFFRCAMERLMHNVAIRHYGPTNLFITGPPVAGWCLEQLHSRMDYTMELSQGTGALFLEQTPVIRTHVLKRSDYKNPTSYGSLWRSREVYQPACAHNRSGP